jgi:hypothetical protein
LKKIPYRRISKNVASLKIKGTAIPFDWSSTQYSRVNFIRVKHEDFVDIPNQWNRFFNDASFIDIELDTRVTKLSPLTYFYTVYKDKFLKNLNMWAPLYYEKMFQLQTYLRRVMQRFYHLLTLRVFFGIFHDRQDARFKLESRTPEEKFIMALDFQLFKFLPKLNIFPKKPSIFYYLKWKWIFVNACIVNSPYYVLKLHDHFHISLFFFIFFFMSNFQQDNLLLYSYKHAVKYTNGTEIPEWAIKIRKDYLKKIREKAQLRKIQKEEHFKKTKKPRP